jgi:hypothetical protein
LQRLSAEQKAVASDDGKIKVTSHPALQDEISGTENGMNLVFLHTTLADGDHFQQILVWTLKSRWQK